MLRTEFKDKYPNLYQLIEYIALDNDMPMKENLDLPIFLTASFEIFEVQAAQLSDDEKKILAMGEQGECDDVVEATGFQYLDDFLAEVFEGILAEGFWVESVYSG